MLQNILSLTADKEEVKLAFKAYVENGVGLMPGFIEERLKYDFAWNSKEQKMINKIIKNSYKYHELSEELEYINLENEFA